MLRRPKHSKNEVVAPEEEEGKGGGGGGGSFLIDSESTPGP